jgi:flagellar biosynthesis activator protein FlaF
MSNPANAYAQAARAAQTTQSPRDLEATILLKAASRFQIIKDNWAEREKDLDDALTYNRKLWTILVTGITSEDNQMPLEIKRNIVALANFIFNHGFQVMAKPAPERLTVLININRDIAAGLRGRMADGESQATNAA